jgi:hypothetical protein
MRLSKEAQKYLAELRGSNGDIHSEFVIHYLKVHFGMTKENAVREIANWEKKQPKLLVE